MERNYEMLATEPDSALMRLRQTEERVSHLNRVLRAIRNVNQLITRERDRAPLIQRACEILVESRGYHNAWIALFGQNRELVASAAAGTALDFATLFEHLGEGETVECMRQAMAYPGVQVIPDPVSACTDCPLAEEYAGRAGLATGLWQAGVAIGLLVVSVPSAFASDEEEQVLLEEVASDIALALHNIETEQRHRQAKEALALQQAELYATLYSISDAVIATDLQGNVTRMNPAAEHLTGWQEAQAIGQPGYEVLRLVDAESRQPVPGLLASLMEQRNTLNLTDQILLLSREGKATPVAGSGAPIVDPMGRTTGAVLILRDQTEEQLARRIVETRLSLIGYAANHTLGELLTRALDDVAAFVDSPIGFYHFVEPDQKTVSLQQWSTRTLHEFCQAEGRGLHYPIDEAGVWVECVRARRPVIHNDYASLPRKKGMPEGHAEVVRELVVPVMREGKVVAILGVGNKSADYTPQDIEIVSYLADVTWEIVHQKRTAEALRDTEERFATVVNSLQAIVYVADMETHELLFVNKFARDRFGDVVGKRCWQTLQAGQTGPCEFCTNARLVEDGQPTGVRTWEFRNTITGHWYHIQDQAIRWVDGRLVRMEVATDVTALKEAEETLQRQVAELNAFSHTVAHDLKNPLGMITAYADLLLEEIEDGTAGNGLLDRYAQNILDTSLKMARIIDELLLLASVRTVEEATLETLDMTAVVATALERLGNVIVEHQAELVAPEAWPAARGYAPWIEEVWVNYISNALKYGGRPPRIEMGASPQAGGRIRFWVRDNGAGIAPEAQAQIFTPFTRLHQVRAEGHGLGLSIVRRIMDKLEGEVGVESEPGHGSEFYFVLPGA
jgi:PAS domain S-box-containing protein